MTSSVSSCLRRTFRPLLRPLVVRWRHRDIRPEDTFLASYPKSGNTWVRNLIANLILDDVRNWHDIDRVSIRVGRHRDYGPALPGGRRLIKTHEPHRSEYRRAILIVRDPRDVAVSMLHYQHRRRGLPSLTDAHWRAFVRRFVGGSATHVGAWHHFNERWLDADDLRSLVIRYEDLHRNPSDVVANMSNFLGLETTPQRQRSAIESSSLAKMRQRENQFRQRRGERPGQFVRSGTTGQGKAILPPDCQRAIEDAMGPMMRRLGYAIGDATADDDAADRQ